MNSFLKKIFDISIIEYDLKEYIREQMNFLMAVIFMSLSTNGMSKEEI